MRVRKRHTQDRERAGPRLCETVWVYVCGCWSVFMCACEHMHTPVSRRSSLNRFSWAVQLLHYTICHQIETLSRQLWLIGPYWTLGCLLFQVGERTLSWCPMTLWQLRRRPAIERRLRTCSASSRSMAMPSQGQHKQHVCHWVHYHIVDLQETSSLTDSAVPLSAHHMLKM